MAWKGLLVYAGLKADPIAPARTEPAPRRPSRREVRRAERDSGFLTERQARAWEERQRRGGR